MTICLELASNTLSRTREEKMAQALFKNTYVTVVKESPQPDLRNFDVNIEFLMPKS